jgi:erythromycin esterase-like protein
MNSIQQAAAAIQESAHEIVAPRDLHPLVAAAGNAQLVLIGEASHGTREFYQIRADLTRELIEEHGFRGVVVEADWPDSFRVHRYVTGRSHDHDAEAALQGFRRFPTWMWRNDVVCNFTEWLREHNAPLPVAERVGFYGMDLYSLHASIEAVLHYLDKHDRKAARAARDRYSCFEHFSKEPQWYGLATSRHGADSCEEEVVRQLMDLRTQKPSFTTPDGHAAEEEFFSAEQNARLVANAESYYRAMYRGRDDSWNLRDGHMFETLTALIEHLDGADAKLVVWAHNSHLGDARATEMGDRGELNVGQLVRQRLGADSFLIGFSTHHGTVTAASSWDEPPERKRVRPGMRGSYEDLFHATGLPAFWIDLREEHRATELLARERLQRAIGVIYKPETERWSHYFHARITQQFDALIHLDETHALEPLDRIEEWDDSELAETYPSAL